MKEVDLIFFDLDGTLVNSAADLVAAANHTRNALGLPSMEHQVIIGFVGEGLENLVESLIGPEFMTRFEEAVSVFLAYYNEHLLDHTSLYPGVKETLDFFSPKKKVIVTNKRFAFTRRITDAMGVTDYFEEIVGRDSMPFRKPDARVLHPFLEKYKVDRTRAIVVGDGVNDVMVAANAGVISCAMLNGFTAMDVLLSCQPDFACENMLELKKLFC